MKPPVSMDLGEYSVGSISIGTNRARVLYIKIVSDLSIMVT